MESIATFFLLSELVGVVMKSIACFFFLFDYMSWHGK